MMFYSLRSLNSGWLTDAWSCFCECNLLPKLSDKIYWRPFLLRWVCSAAGARGHLCLRGIRWRCSSGFYPRTSKTSWLCLDDPKSSPNYHLPQDFELVANVSVYLEISSLYHLLDGSRLASCDGSYFEYLWVAAFS
jgi:hypothetical protein